MDSGLDVNELFNKEINIDQVPLRYTVNELTKKLKDKYEKGNSTFKVVGSNTQQYKKKVSDDKSQKISNYTKTTAH